MAARLRGVEPSVPVKTLNVLVLCTGNSARSIMTEALLNTLGEGRVRAYSAGSHPTGLVNPLAIEQLVAANIRATGLHSKSWIRFVDSGAPHMDIVLTVCGNAAGERCPVWPGNPSLEHWNIADPAGETGDLANRRTAFMLCFIELRRRSTEFLTKHTGAMLG
ncbi:MAG: arsenate reductase ArsC [Gammaproteobacteria bacterium]|nr:arsenate reductase ArsC [Gammaproteobacteria bacterium]